MISTSLSALSAVAADDGGGCWAAASSGSELSGAGICCDFLIEEAEAEAAPVGRSGTLGGGGGAVATGGRTCGEINGPAGW